MGNITSLLQKRFSTRSFQPQLIQESILEDILEAGRLSPSGGNEQPWRFGVLIDPDLIKQVAALAYHQDWIAQSPLLIVLCTVFAADELGGRVIQIQRYPEYAGVFSGMDADIYHALNQEEHQTKIAGTHMALAALEHGLGSCWVSRFEVQALHQLLNLPANMLPTEILVFGYPASWMKPLRKKSLEELVFYNSWSEG